MTKKKNKEAKLIDTIVREQERIMYPVVGSIADPGKSGEIMVEFNKRTPKAARLLAGLDRNKLSKKENVGRQVLLVFENGDPDRPIIIGQIENFLEDIVSGQINKDKTDAQAVKPKEAIVDGERIVIEAEKEIVLKCGKGSITIRKDGKIVTKGTNILSRSSGAQRIKGGSVSIN